MVARSAGAESGPVGTASRSKGSWRGHVADPLRRASGVGAFSCHRSSGSARPSAVRRRVPIATLSAAPPRSRARRRRGLKEFPSRTDGSNTMRSHTAAAVVLVREADLAHDPRAVAADHVVDGRRHARSLDRAERVWVNASPRAGQVSL